MADSFLITRQDFQRTVADAVVRSANPEKVFLFGSAARGDATSDSDLDLLVVEPSSFGPTHSRRDVVRKIREALSMFPVSKDILVFSADEFAKWSQSPNHVVARCLSEGRLIYERS
jgi:predicted nucleotidyltransferase